jgi:Homoserine acetyltransferase
MKVERLRNFSVLTALFTFLIFVSSLLAQELVVTPQYFHIKDFKFQSGEVLPDMVVEYATIGTKKVDSAGAITNALVWCHGWSGNAAQIKESKGVVGPGKVFDTDQYFIILPTMIGSPGSSSPSTSKLGPKFPKYTVGDMVKAQYVLVTEHLKIKHVKGVVGPSMGGYQVLEWAVSYPDFMDFIIPVATSYENTGRVLGIFALVSNAIQTDPAYQGGNYKEQPLTGMKNGFMSNFLWYFTDTFFKEKYPTTEAMLKALNGAGQAATRSDANDVVWRNDSMRMYGTKDRIPNIKARALVIGINQDELFPPPDTIALSKAIKGAEVFRYDSIFGHVGCAYDLIKAEKVIRDFMK